MFMVMTVGISGKTYRDSQCNKTHVGFVETSSLCTEPSTQDAPATEVPGGTWPPPWQVSVAPPFGDMLSLPPRRTHSPCKPCCAPRQQIPHRL